MFSERAAPKVRLLEKAARAAVLVPHIPQEPARWVSLQGRAAIDAEAGQAAATRLAERSLRSPAVVAGAVDLFAQADFVRISLVPDRIRTYAEVY